MAFARRSPARSFAAVALVVPFAIAACSDGTIDGADPGSSGKGGTSGTAGIGSGGKSGAGAGTNGSGGASGSGSGGASGNGSGGVAATGGSSGSGGSSATGGSGGSSGTAGSGGSNYMPPPLEGGCTGKTTRYWDCCKPHCAWSGNASGTSPLASCTQSDQSMGGNYDAQSACNGGDAYMCHDLAPWAENDQVAYGFAAVRNQDNICGRCYQVLFTGPGPSAPGDAGSQAIAGKTMFVQIINVGNDVEAGQFDLLIPGGGVGAFNACSSQWGVSNTELGAQYGGFLPGCKSGDLNATKSCMLQKCQSVFGSRGLTELMSGCEWFVNWFQTADNPGIQYKEVQCPSAITNRSGMNRSNSNSGCG
jgi:hypothetical protein